MAYGGSNSANNYGANPVTVTLTGVAANATIIVIAWGNTSATGVNDGNAYTLVGSYAGQQATVWKLLNAPAGSHTINVTTSAGGYYVAAAWFSNGDVTGTPLIQDDSFLGNGANIITGNVTPAGDNATLIGFCSNTSGSVTYTAGTTPNAFTNMAVSGLAATLGIWEYFQLGASTGGSAQTITIGNGNGTGANSGQWIVYMALAAASGGGGPPPSQFFLGAAAAGLGWIIDRRNRVPQEERAWRRRRGSEILVPAHVEREAD